VDVERRGLARTSSGIAFLAALGVVSGFVVDAAMAALFGASASTDAFFIAATIPFAVGSVLLASTNQALVPLIAGWFRTSEDADALVKVERFLGTALVAAIGVAGVGVAAASWLTHVIAPGASASTRSAATAMAVLLFATVVTRVGAEILRALLNARFAFLAPAAMPIVENVAVLAVMLALADRLGVRAVAVGYVVGGIGQLGYMVAVAVSRGLRPVPRLAPRDADVRAAFRLLRLPLAGTGTNMVARAVERSLASFLPAGSITILNYAWVVVNSIGGAIFFRSVVVALLPRLARVVDDRAATRRILLDGLRLMALISFPLTALVLVLADPLVATAFMRGAFSASDAAALASVLGVYALQFPLDAAVRVLLSSSYARLDTRTPFVNVAIGAVLDVAFAVALFSWLGVAGIALAYVLSSLGNLAHAFVATRRRIDVSIRPLRATIARASVVAVVAGAVAWAVLATMPEGGSLVVRAIRLTVPATTATIAGGIALVAAGFRPSRLRSAARVAGTPSTPREDGDPTTGG
jgi:putative peptidoglycan lipid II flippase